MERLMKNETKEWLNGWINESYEWVNEPWSNQLTRVFVGLMISGFARAGQVLGEDVYTKRAIKAAEFIRNNLYDKDTKELLRSCYRENSDQVAQM